jgi:hypothetical protein
MTDTNTVEKAGSKKAAIEYDIPLFADVISDDMVYSDKRFPGGRVRLYMEVPQVEDADSSDLLMSRYNKGLIELLGMGIKQNVYYERDWDILKKANDAQTDEAIIANIENEFGPIDSMDEDKLKEFFEAGLFAETTERKASAEKVVAKQLKSAGITQITPEMIAKLKEMAAAENL